jgi:hypothetical protein
MPFPFEKCRTVLCDGALAALEQGAGYILGLERAAQGNIPVNGLAFDLAPWHEGIGMSLRVAHPVGEYGDNSADWQHADFVSSDTCPPLAAAASVINAAYYSRGEDSSVCMEMAHLIFLAGAEALLDARIARQLQKLDVNAPLVEDGFSTYCRFYMVFDPDETVKANYCEIVLANRVTARLLAGG